MPCSIALTAASRLLLSGPKTPFMSSAWGLKPQRGRDSRGCHVIAGSGDISPSPASDSARQPGARRAAPRMRGPCRNAEISSHPARPLALQAAPLAAASRSSAITTSFRHKPPTMSTHGARTSSSLAARARCCRCSGAEASTRLLLCRVGGRRPGTARRSRLVRGCLPPPHRTVHAVLPHTALRHRSPAGIRKGWFHGSGQAIGAELVHPLIVEAGDPVSAL